MGKVLSESAIRQYNEKGYYYPVDVFSAEEVAHYRSQLEAYESSAGHPLMGGERNKSHLLFCWVDEVMRNERIVDIVEDLIGPDILCWNTLFWIKEAGSDSFVSWHQDLKYWGLDTNDLVTVWVAFSPANKESGCMRVLPGTHRGEMLEHADEYHDNNLLTRGQSVSEPIDESEAVWMPLEPGQVSLHNVRLAHASGANLSSDRRIGLSLHYIPAGTRQTVAEWDSAALIRGRDDSDSFELAPIPLRDFDPECVAFHERATQAVRDILFHDAQRVRGTL